MAIVRVSMSFEPGVPASADVIPLCVPEIRGNEWNYIKECLDTNFVSSVGPFVDRFERMVADYVGTRHAVAAVNGTAALHIALKVAGVCADDEVLVSTLSFIAPANAIRYLGAWPIFIDAEPDYWQMDPGKVQHFLERECAWKAGELRNKITGRRISAIVPVHILGHPVNMDPILELARKYELPVIEDATESLGAKYKDRMAGHLGDIACFSFNGNKIITTGGGGMIVTDNEAWATKAKYLSTQAKDDPLEYIHNEVGYNYRLTNLQAAMGCAQLEQLESYILAKRAIAADYSRALSVVPGLSFMSEAPWAFSSFWMSTVLVDEAQFGMGSRGLLRHLSRQGIHARPLWQPLHRSPAHENYAGDCFAVADRLHEQALSLPCSVGLGQKQRARVTQAVQAANPQSISNANAPSVTTSVSS
jgi:perosamine synthetase